MRQVILIALLATLSGCTGGDGGVVTVTLWHQKTGAERDFLDRVVDEYNAGHDDHRLVTLYRETEELRNLFVIASAGGKGPDLVFGPSDNVSILAITGTVQPVTAVLGDAYLSDFSEEGIVRWEGEPYMIADQVGNHLTFVYNRDLMPEPPQTIEEMVASLESATRDLDGDGRIDQYGLTWNYTEPFFFAPFLACFGGEMMDDEGTPTLDTDATVRAVQFILDLRDRYKVIPASTDYETAEMMFKDGTAAAIINGPWAWAGYGEAGINYGLTRIPYMTETGNWCSPLVSAKGYSVNTNLAPERVQYVRQVLEYLTDASIQTRMAEELATIPVIASVRESPEFKNNDFLQASLRQLEVGKAMPMAPQLRQVWDGMRGPYQLVMNGAVTAEEGARLMQAEVEKRIADAFL